jgi:hypothetical protein
MPHLPEVAGHAIVFSSIAAKREFAGALVSFTCDTLFCAQLGIAGRWERRESNIK